MKLVIVSTLGAVHLHVVSEIARRHAPLAVLQPYRAPAPPPPVQERLGRFRRAPLDVLRESVEQRVRTARMERSEAEIATLLFGGAPPHVEATPIPVSELHAPRTLERLRALEPDLLFLSGAPVLRPELFGLARLGTVNLHYGVAPEYRGEDTLFWPLVRADHERLGVTLHTVDQGVDTGRLLAHGFPERRGGEGETELWAASAQLGARLAVRLLDALRRALDGGMGDVVARAMHGIGDDVTRPLSGVPQPAGGRQYFRRERTALWEMRYHAGRALGRTPPPAAERVVFY